MAGKGSTSECKEVLLDCIKEMESGSMGSDKVVVISYGNGGVDFRCAKMTTLDIAGMLEVTKAEVMAELVSLDP